MCLTYTGSGSPTTNLLPPIVFVLRKKEIFCFRFYRARAPCKYSSFGRPEVGRWGENFGRNSQTTCLRPLGPFLKFGKQICLSLPISIRLAQEFAYSFVFDCPYTESNTVLWKLFYATTVSNMTFESVRNRFLQRCFKNRAFISFFAYLLISNNTGAVRWQYFCRSFDFYSFCVCTVQLTRWRIG